MRSRKTMLRYKSEVALFAQTMKNTTMFTPEILQEEVGPMI
ncbi:MAG: hypothetical protein ACI32G_08150 [Bulleidia sp.]